MSATAVDVVIAGKKTSIETGLFINYEVRSPLDPVGLEWTLTEMLV
jgi:hypothetical protein